jgi:hypothetical protein
VHQAQRTEKHVIAIARRLAVGVVLAGAAVGLASPASADQLNGSYSGTLIDGTGRVLNQKPVSLNFSPCGPDCTHMRTPSHDLDLHPQGDVWVANYDWNGSPCTTTVNGNTLILDDVCPNQQPMRLSLAKNG